MREGMGTRYDLEKDTRAERTISAVLEMSRKSFKVKVEEVFKGLNGNPDFPVNSGGVLLDLETGKKH